MAKKSKQKVDKKSSKKSKSKGSKSKEKSSYAAIGQYLVSKSDVKYIKIECSPKADKEVKKLVKDLIKVLGSDILFVNLFDKDFKSKYDIPDFVKGRISVNLDAETESEDDDEDEDEDEDEDDDDDEDDDEDDEDEDDGDDSDF